MTPKQRRAYSEVHQRTIKRLEGKFIKPIYDAIHSQILKFTHILRSSTINHAKAEIDRTIINEDLLKPLTDLYNFFGLYQAKKTLREINASAKTRIVVAPPDRVVTGNFEQKAGPGFGINEKLLELIISFYKKYLLIKAIIPITQTTREQILNLLIKGEQEGWGVDRIAMELENPNFSLWRARMIVRTESLFAMQYGRQAAETESRWQTEGEWIASNDHRTRHSHRDVDGIKVDTGKRFRVPIYKSVKGVQIRVGTDLMLGPGDPTASAGNVINCRCSLATVAKRDANGRLIPKKVGNSNISVILPKDVFKPTQIITI